MHNWMIFLHSLTNFTNSVLEPIKRLKVFLKVSLCIKKPLIENGPKPWKMTRKKITRSGWFWALVVRGDLVWWKSSASVTTTRLLDQLCRILAPHQIHFTDPVAIHGFENSILTGKFLKWFCNSGCWQPIFTDLVRSPSCLLIPILGSLSTWVTWTLAQAGWCGESSGKGR